MSLHCCEGIVYIQSSRYIDILFARFFLEKKVEKNAEELRILWHRICHWMGRRCSTWNPVVAIDVSIEGNIDAAKERGDLAFSPPTKFGRKKGARPSLPKQPLATRLLPRPPTLLPIPLPPPLATASSIGPNLHQTRLRISHATSKGILPSPPPPSSVVRLDCRGAGIDPGLVCSLSPVTNPNLLGSFLKFCSGVLLVPILEAVTRLPGLL